MPDSIEDCVARVLRGEQLEHPDALVCDFSLLEQNEALESQGISPSVDPNYKPVLGGTVTYIVAAVLINDHDEVLMMQEAKSSCAGKWYLPAGRIEKNETFVEAFSREVLEETSLIVTPTTLVMVECARGSWVRFVMTGTVTGGTLKTPAQADSESLQAKWVKNLDELPLRSQDFLHIVERGRLLVAARRSGGGKNSSVSASASASSVFHLDMLPSSRVHERAYLRLLIVTRSKTSNRVHVLVSERTAWHLPVCEINPSKSMHSTLRRFMVELFGAEVAKHRPHGLLSVEHNPAADGLCLTLLVVFWAPLEEVPIVGKCIWHETSQSLGDQIMTRVMHKNSTIPLHVIN